MIVGGGFSANSQLRAKLLEVGAEHGVEVRVPQLKLCTDNGAMVAMLASTWSKREWLRQTRIRHSIRPCR